MHIFAKNLLSLILLIAISLLLWDVNSPLIYFWYRFTVYRLFFSINSY